MKQIIRYNAFETNSSSVHSICLCSEEEYQKFVEGELVWCSEELIRSDSVEGFDEEYIKEYAEENGYDEIDDDVKAEAYDQFCRENDMYTYNKLGGESYECFEHSYTTKNGDKVYAIGYYGNGY